MSVKGKERAMASVVRGDERAPLLAGSTSSFSSQDIETTEAGTLVYRRRYDGTDLSQEPIRTRPQQWAAFFAQALRWLSVFVIVAFFVFMIFLATLWATLNTAPAARQLPDAIVAHATRWRTVSIEFLGVREGDIDVSVSGELGFDTEWILGVEPEDQSALAYARRAVGRWLVSSLGGMKTTAPTTVSIFDYDGVFLFNCTTGSFSVDIIPNHPHTREIRMAPIQIPLSITPTTESSDLVAFANATWLYGGARISAYAPTISVQAAKRPWWFPKVTTTIRDVSTNLHVSIPQIPKQYPQPGSPIELSDILSIDSYAVNIKQGEGPFQIGFSAFASLLLPFTSPSAAGIHLPANMPLFSFLVSLIDPRNSSSTETLVPFASLATIPQLNTTADLASISFPITGSVLPIESDTVPPLSSLVSNYLSALPSTIVIESASSPPTNSSIPLTFPPAHVTFPGPAVKPHILQSVTIKDMKLGASPSGEELTCSGTLIASFVLPAEVAGGPGGLSDRLIVRRLWPDALVYDGPPPATNTSYQAVDERPQSTAFGDDKPAPPLPNPLPERAFARIRPLEWVDAEMLPDTDSGDKKPKIKVRYVTAKIVDAPLDVLPGREDEFQAFFAKVLKAKGQGALAGVRGASSIALRIDGFSLPRDRGGEEQDIEFDGLAFEGTFLIGKKSS